MTLLSRILLTRIPLTLACLAWARLTLARLTWERLTWARLTWARLTLARLIWAPLTPTGRSLAELIGRLFRTPAFLAPRVAVVPSAAPGSVSRAVSVRRLTAGVLLLGWLTACTPEGGEPASGLSGETGGQMADGSDTRSLRAGEGAGAKSIDSTDAACPARALPDYAKRMVGADQARIDQWPGFAAIMAISPDEKTSQFYCGGLLITPDSVLTAAHCLDGLTRTADGRPWRRINGALWAIGVMTNQVSVTADAPATRARVVRGDVYADGEEAYDRRNYRNDIAILTLDRRLTGQPLARLSGSGLADPVFDHHLMWAAGFGRQTSGQARQSFPTDAGGAALSESEVLRDAVLPLASYEDCIRVLSTSAIEDARQICAGWNRGGRDTCAGDSGGPLIALDTQGCPYAVGLTSYGSKRGCAVADTYGVYTRISYFRDWISRQAPEAQFVATPPAPLGADAQSVMLETIIDRFSELHPGLSIALVDRDTGEPLPEADGRVIITSGRALAYRVSSAGVVRGQLLLIDRRQQRGLAGGPVRGGPVRGGAVRNVFTLVYPQNLSQGKTTLIELGAGRPQVMGGTGGPVLQIASLSDPGATSEAGEVIALILPPDIAVDELFGSGSASLGNKAQAEPLSGRALFQMEAVSALIENARTGTPEERTSGRFVSGQRAYQIIRR